MNDGVLCLIEVFQLFTVDCRASASEFKAILYFLLYQVQGMWFYVEVFNPFVVMFCAGI